MRLQQAQETMEDVGVRIALTRPVPVLGARDNSERTENYYMPAILADNTEKALSSIEPVLKRQP